MTKQPKRNVLRLKQMITELCDNILKWLPFKSSHFKRIVFQHLFWRPAGLHLMEVTVHNGSFVRQPRGITIIGRLGGNKQTSWMWTHDRKSEPGVREICGQMPKRQLTVQVFGWAQEWFRSFCLVWPGTDHNPAPDTIDHTVGQTEREGEREI